MLLILIHRKSELTYLEHEIKFPDENNYRVSWDASYGRLLARIKKSYHVDRWELERLKNIFIVYHGKARFMSRISEEQQDILNRLGMPELEVH